MDYRVVWSPEAVEDLESIARYIERDSKYYANAVVTKILDEARILADFPLMGRVVPEMNDNKIREKFIYSYRLIYQIQEDVILIVAIIHGKRLFNRFADRFAINNPGN